MNGGKRGGPTTAPKHINDFTKALAGEVRILLQEVGQLRDEKRQLQYEIAELMAVKAKHGAGGEYTPDWAPKYPVPEALAAPPPQSAIEEAPHEPAPPAWRTIIKHEPRRNKHKGPKSPHPQQITAAPMPVAPMPQVPSWAQWKPNPSVVPQPRPGAVPAAAAPAPSPRDDGLFGPRTPPPK